MKQTIFLNGRFLDFRDAHISPYDRGFNFADGIYEVVRSYNGFLFQWDAHIERLKYGLQELTIKGADVAQLKSIVYQLLDENQLLSDEALIYMQITRGVAPRSHKLTDSKMEPTIFVTATEFIHPTNEREQGVKAILTSDIRWARCDIKTIGLLPNTLARQKASEQGAAEALFIRDGVVLEGTHSSFFAVMDDVLMTAPLTNYILPGVTRNVVIDLCKSVGLTLKIAPIFADKLEAADELMIVGTTVEITPIVQVNSLIVSNGTPGEITIQLQRQFNQLIQNGM